MYKKYHTEALIVGSRASGEGDRIYALLTEELGLVHARASAVRKEMSRMRYALQNYSRVYVSLVHGSRGWRVAGATAIMHVSRNMRAAAAFARLSELVERLVRGEGSNRYLFAALAEAHSALMVERGTAWATIEIVCAARVLYALGYISSEALSAALFAHTEYSEDLLLEAEAVRDKLVVLVNKAIAQSQL